MVIGLDVITGVGADSVGSETESTIAANTEDKIVFLFMDMPFD